MSTLLRFRLSPAGQCLVCLAALLALGSAAVNAAPAPRPVGTVVAWGSNSAGESTVPAGLTGVVAVAAGEQHSLALKRDGTVVAWGYNSDGQAKVPPGLPL